MKRTAALCLFLIAATLGFFLGMAGDNRSSITEEFRKYGQLLTRTRGKVYDTADSNDKELIRQLRNMDRALLKRPTGQLLEAIEQSIPGADKLETIGALSIYTGLIVYKRTVPDPRFKPWLLEMLAKDDFRTVEYSEEVSGALGWYPSRETMQARMDAAKRAPEQEIRDEFVEATAAMLDVQLNYTLSDPTPERKRQALAAFQAWYEKNKDNIRFDEQGEPHFHGGPGQWKPPKLTADDKGRIKADPACILRLFETIQDSQDPNIESIVQLNSRCGRALLGDKGSAALAEKLEQTKKGSPPALDLESSLSTMTFNYPCVSAVVTAVAYVASGEVVDPDARRLAGKILEDFGGDLDDILKGEPSGVRKKVRKFADSLTP